MTQSGERCRRLVEDLAEETGSGLVDLRWANGFFYVRLMAGGRMCLVQGPENQDPVLALLDCLGRWRDRSHAKPFLYRRFFEPTGRWETFAIFAGGL